MNKQISLLFSIVVLSAFLASTVPKKSIQNSNNTTAYSIDTLKSKLYWDCYHKGTMRINAGQFVFSKKDELSEMNLSVDLISIKNIDIDNELLQGTLENVLRSVEFFNTEKYPEAFFKSHSISKIKDDIYKFTGDFILFDNGICYDFEADVSFKNDSLYFQTKSIVLDRTDWGIFYVSANNPYPKEEENGFTVTDTIQISAHLVAYKNLE